MRHYARRVKPIGGYIELQVQEGQEYYPNLIKLNTARNALEYILKENKYSQIYLPYYTCEVLLEPIERLGIPYHFYTIDENLDPVIDFYILPNECLLYTNYFGIKQRTVDKLALEIKNLIIDNSQAFYSKPLPQIDTFYSCRKFFGVPDGAYLQSKIVSLSKYETDVSIKRVSHLLKSIEFKIEDGYQDFLENNNVLSDNPIKMMSKLSQKILSGIDYDLCKEKRHQNFKILHQELEVYNKLPITFLKDDAPMVYPFLINKHSLKKKLIDKRIFIATYWPNVLKWTSEKMFEHYLTENLLALPIDHRYSEIDMLRIINTIKQHL